jgi:hypothetical protein
MAKWAARTALGLFNSVPGLMLENNQLKGKLTLVCNKFKAKLFTLTMH